MRILSLLGLVIVIAIIVWLVSLSLRPAAPANPVPGGTPAMTVPGVGNPRETLDTVRGQLSGARGNAGAVNDLVNSEIERAGKRVAAESGDGEE